MTSNGWFQSSQIIELLSGHLLVFFVRNGTSLYSLRSKNFRDRAPNSNFRPNVRRILLPTKLFFDHFWTAHLVVSSNPLSWTSLAGRVRPQNQRSWPEWQDSFLYHDIYITTTWFNLTLPTLTTDLRTLKPSQMKKTAMRNSMPIRRVSDLKWLPSSAIIC